MPSPTLPLSPISSTANSHNKPNGINIPLVILTLITNTNTVNVIQDGVINIKPLVNLTINKLGLLDEPDDDSSQKADSPTNVLKSMFNIWNPEVGGESLRQPALNDSGKRMGFKEEQGIQGLCEEHGRVWGCRLQKSRKEKD